MRNTACRLTLLATVVLGTGCGARHGAKDYPDVGPIQSFEGESVPGGWGFGAQGDNSASNNQSMEFYSTVSVKYPLEVIRAASGIVVRAKGDDCQGPPTMEVDVDGRQVLKTDVKSKRWADYPATVPLSLGMHTFTVSFLNDRYEPPSCDRNLYLDKITLVNAHPPDNGELESVALLSPPASMLVGDPLAKHGHALGMMSGGTALGQTNVLVPTGEIVVRARGEDCKGPPLLVLSVDGVERLSIQVTSNDWKEYRAPVDLAPGVHNVSVEFPNDYYEPPSCDRNLYLDTIRFLPKAAPAAP
jgi:hypothetical protein